MHKIEESIRVALVRRLVNAKDGIITNANQIVNDLERLLSASPGALDHVQIEEEGACQ
jgi:hypothetical protein